MAHLLDLSSSPYSRKCIISVPQKNVSYCDWVSLSRRQNCNGRFLCLFSDNRKREEAKKALSSALDGKKTEFDKWNKEIKKREEMGGRGGRGNGGQSGWFGWSNDDHFWKETQQTSLTILGIILIYLLIAKGEVMFAVFVNPILGALRSPRSGFTFIRSLWLSRKMSTTVEEEVQKPASAKVRVLRKWKSE